MLFFWKFYSSKNPDKMFPAAKIVFNINQKWAANQHIIMIPEGSCDTEDWRNDAVVFVLYETMYLKLWIKKINVV